MRNKESAEERAKRLNSCPAGRALVKFLARHSSHAQTARELGLGTSVIAQWMLRGRISRTGARLAEEKLGIKKETLRPDITADGWSLGTPGRTPGAEVVRDSYDQETLAQLVKHYGSVREFCATAGVKIGQFHNWLSRGKIAAQAIPKLAELDLPDGIRARLAGDGEK